MNDLQGTVAIVTGAAQGIGAEYARQLAAAGAAVALSDILDPSPVVEEIKAGGGKAIGRTADITSAADMTALAAETVEAFGGITILVNNAAIFASLQRKPLLEISSEEWSRVIDINIRGPFETVKAVVPYMREKGYGKIVNISSTTMMVGQPNLLHYVTSKGAIQAMTRSLARELGPEGIRVNCIAPGFTLSEGVNANEQFTGQFKGMVAAQRAIARDQQPSDLAGTLLYLCAPSSDFVSGQTLVVDGGAVMS